MAKALVVYANGSEDMEVTCAVSILHRGGVELTKAAITNDGSKTVVLSHGTVVTCDKHISECNDSYDLIVIPGGIPGSNNCAADSHLLAKLKEQKAAGRYIAAICAAPGFVLAQHGFIDDSTQATGYPSCCDNIKNYTGTATCIDSKAKIITGKGPALAIEFGLACLSVLVDEHTLAQVIAGMLYHQ